MFHGVRRPELSINQSSFFFFSKIFFFNVDHLQIFIEFVTILLLFCVLDFWLGMWDVSSLSKDETHSLCTVR